MATWLVIAIAFYAGYFFGCWFGYAQRVKEETRKAAANG